MRKKKLYLGTVLALMLTTTILSGCKKSDEEEWAEDVSGNDYELEQEDVSGDIWEDEDGYVSSVEELLESIAPGAEIYIESGYYNLSEYVEEVWKQEGESWNANHPYVQLSECYDGVEVIVQDVDGLYITGESGDPADTEIVIEPRHGAVFNFVNCNDLVLESLTMGHTESGECSGNVLNFALCNYVELYTMDLYGCGVYGIGAENGTGDLYVYDSVIRDCWAGPFHIVDGVGSFEFSDCIMTGSESAGLYEGTEESDLAFYGCVFGQKESEGLYYREDIYTDECTWSGEFEDYSDSEDEEDMEEESIEEEEYEEFNTQSWTQISPDMELLEYSYWEGYAMVDDDGDVLYLPYENQAGESVTGVSVELDEEGIGYIEYQEEVYEVNWSCDNQNSLSFQSDEVVASAFLYEEPYDEDVITWMKLELNGKTFWLY